MVVCGHQVLVVKAAIPGLNITHPPMKIQAEFYLENIDSKNASWLYLVLSMQW